MPARSMFTSRTNSSSSSPAPEIRLGQAAEDVDPEVGVAIAGRLDFLEGVSPLLGRWGA